MPFRSRCRRTSTRWSPALLAKGCHLLIEKPICASLAEAEQVLAAARAHGAMVQVGHIEHFNPVMGFLTGGERAAVHHRGAARAVHAARHRGRRGARFDDSRHRHRARASVKSPVATIPAWGERVVENRGHRQRPIQFANGCVANLSASRMSLKKVREIRVFQPTGYFSFDFMNQSGHLVRKAGMLEYAAKLMSGAVQPGDLAAVPVEPVPLEKGEPLALELAHFVESVAQAKQPKVGGALGKSALEVAIAITEQIRGTRT